MLPEWIDQRPECAQHIHANVLPGCFQIRRANPKRLQLLKRGFVLDFGAPGTPGCSHGAAHVAFTNLLRKLAWIVSFSTYFPIRNNCNW